MIDLSFVGWLTLAAAALLAWAAFPALSPRRRLCVSIACAALVAIVMLHPPETDLATPEAAAPPEPAHAPPAPIRKAAPPAALAPEAAAPEAAAPEAAAPEAAAPGVAVPAAPQPTADPCVALAGLKKEQCTACDGGTGLTRALCEGAAKSRYCSDKTGRDPDCPGTSAPSDPA